LIRVSLLTICFFYIIGGAGEEGFTAYVEPFVILTILVANAIISIWQDKNADNALEALKEMQAVECKLLRDR
jgi:magnesium-transporting ATPase (P-type)